jgi:hypothetical protein
MFAILTAGWKAVSAAGAIARGTIRANGTVSMIVAGVVAFGSVLTAVKLHDVNVADNATERCEAAHKVAALEAEVRILQAEARRGADAARAAAFERARAEQAEKDLAVKSVELSVALSNSQPAGRGTSVCLPRDIITQMGKL